MKRKQKLVLTGFLGFTFLFGCSQVDNGEVEAGLPESFKVVADTEIDSFTYGIEVTHLETGCHFVYVNGDRDGGLTQMFIEKDGVSVPYCE